MPDNAVRRWVGGTASELVRVDRKFITGRTGMSPVGGGLCKLIGEIKQDRFPVTRASGQNGQRRRRAVQPDLTSHCISSREIDCTFILLQSWAIPSPVFPPSAISASPY